MLDCEPGSASEPYRESSELTRWLASIISACVGWGTRIMSLSRLVLYRDTLLQRKQIKTLIDHLKERKERKAISGERKVCGLRVQKWGERAAYQWLLDLPPWMCRWPQSWLWACSDRSAIYIFIAICVLRKFRRIAKVLRNPTLGWFLNQFATV